VSFGPQCASPAARFGRIRSIQQHPQHPAVSVNLKHPQDPQQRPFRSIALYRSPAHVPARGRIIHDKEKFA
jgi:hypothetical protein